MVQSRVNLETKNIKWCHALDAFKWTDPTTRIDNKKFIEQSDFSLILILLFISIANLINKFNDFIKIYSFLTCFNIIYDNFLSLSGTL